MKKLGKKFWIPMGIAIAVVALFVIIFPIIWCCVINVDLKVTAAQVGETQTINLKWQTSKPIDKIKITVKHNGDLVSEQIITDDVVLQTGDLNIDAFYGKQTVIVKIYRKAYFTTKKVTVGLTAKKYNIAPITATMPVTLFTLSLDSITENGTVPTFVWFKRSGAWDWTQLPESVYPMPVASNSELMDSSQGKMYKETTAYVKELYELDKDSFFNFYYNDYFAYGWLSATIGNGIPEENYHVTLLSDGTASYNYFNKHFDNENWEANYESMVKDWTKLKSQVAKRHSYTELSVGYAIKAGTLREYAYVMAREESNVDWWLTRISGTMATNTPEAFDALNELTATENGEAVKVKDLGTILKGFTEDQKAKLKKLYKFNDDMFEKATMNDKKVMVFIGTWTQDETDFDTYVKMMMDFYGDDYAYFYKGHPKNPTGTVSGKLEHLESLGLTDIESTIPAELIIFFNPDLCMCGYPSSTFVSATDEQTGAIFLAEKDDEGDIESYKENVDFFAKKIKDHSKKAEYAPLANENCYVLEFTNTTEYDIAIYNPTERTFTYYKKVGQEYQKVN